ncbi:Phospholipase D1 [Thoreauomyces humboldtii]|nr:Phospholipase D1 [Thoreauomyces humboldtii]
MSDIELTDGASTSSKVQHGKTTGGNTAGTPSSGGHFRKPWMRPAGPSRAATATSGVSTPSDSPFRFLNRHGTTDMIRAWRDKSKLPKQRRDSADSSNLDDGRAEAMFVSASNTGYPEPMFKDLEVKLLRTTAYNKKKSGWDKVKLRSYRKPPGSGHRKDGHEVEFTHVPTGTHWVLSMRPKDFYRFSTLLSDPDHNDPRFKGIQKHLRRRCALSPMHLELIKQPEAQRKTEAEAVEDAKETEAEKGTDDPDKFLTPKEIIPHPKPLAKSEKRGEELVAYLRGILKEVKEPWNVLGEDWAAVEARRHGMVVCGFIELSRTSLIGTWEDGVKGKEGWAKKRRGGRKNDVFCFPDFLVPRTSQRRWMALRSNYLLYFYSPMDLTPQEVMLIDGYFQVLHKNTQKKEQDLRPKDDDPTGNMEDRVNTRPGGRQHHAARNALVLRPFNRRTNEVWVRDKNKLAILNGFRDLLIDFHYEIGGRGRARVAREWALQLDSRRQKTSWYKGVQADVGRYDAFSPVREGQSAAHVEWMVDGSAHFEQMHAALSSAEKEILIADWFITPEVFLRRASDGVHREHMATRLDRLLIAKANAGVKIYILLYKEMNLPNASMHAKEVLMGRKKPLLYLDADVEDPDNEFELTQKNIVVLRHPDQGLGFTGVLLDSVMWAHHEKAAVVDRKIAFIGGIDLCVGRYDTAEHTLRDDVIYTSRGEVEYAGTAAGDDAPHQPVVGDDHNHDHSMVDCPHPSHKRASEMADKAGDKVHDAFDDSEDDEPRKADRKKAQGSKETVTEQGMKASIPNGLSHSMEADTKGTSKPTNFRETNEGGLTQLQDGLGDAPGRAGKDVESKPMLNAFPGQDYSNPRIKDFVKLGEEACQDCIPRDHTARMPWHDIGCTFRKVAGQEDVEGPVDDLVWHFIQRWNFAKWEKKKTDHVIPWLYPSQGLKRVAPEVAPAGSVQMQVLRSASQWSAGSPREKSINNAYLDLIRGAKHYVYIENQFFITKFAPPSDKVASDHKASKKDSENDHGQMLPKSGVRIHNPIASALVQRILVAFRKQEVFRVYIVIPLFPAFYGDVTKGDADPSLSYVLSAQTECIRGLIDELKKGGIPDEKINDYICFIGLRKWDILGKRLITEQIYIHAKLMIVDDNQVLIGSANINDRSQMGSRDSELAILVRDTENTGLTTTMNGTPYPHAASFAYTLRLRLFHEHLGVAFPHDLRDVHTPQQDPATFVFSEPRLADPISPACWDLWSERIDTNTQALRHVFQCVPDDTVRSWKEYHTFLQTRGGKEEEELEKGMEDLAKEQGVPLTLRLPDLRVNLDNNKIQQRDSENDLATKAEEHGRNPPAADGRNGEGGRIPQEGDRLALDILQEHVKGHAVRFPVEFLADEQLNKLFSGLHKLAPRRVFT